jgi:hypothetical protein
MKPRLRSRFDKVIAIRIYKLSALLRTSLSISSERLYSGRPTIYSRLARVRNHKTNEASWRYLLRFKFAVIRNATKESLVDLVMVVTGSNVDTHSYHAE